MEEPCLRRSADRSAGPQMAPLAADIQVYSGCLARRRFSLGLLRSATFTSGERRAAVITAPSWLISGALSTERAQSAPHPPPHPPSLPPHLPGENGTSYSPVCCRRSRLPAPPPPSRLSLDEPRQSERGARSLFKEHPPHPPPLPTPSLAV